MRSSWCPGSASGSSVAGRPARQQPPAVGRLPGERASRMRLYARDDIFGRNHLAAAPPCPADADATAAAPTACRAPPPMPPAGAGCQPAAARNCGGGSRGSWPRSRLLCGRVRCTGRLLESPPSACMQQQHKGPCKCHLHITAEGTKGTQLLLNSTHRSRCLRRRTRPARRSASAAARAATCCPALWSCRGTTSLTAAPAHCGQSSGGCARVYMVWGLRFLVARHSCTLQVVQPAACVKLLRSRQACGGVFLCQACCAPFPPLQHPQHLEPGRLPLLAEQLARGWH